MFLQCRLWLKVLGFLARSQQLVASSQVIKDRQQTAFSAPERVSNFTIFFAPVSSKNQWKKGGRTPIYGREKEIPKAPSSCRRPSRSDQRSDLEKRNERSPSPIPTLLTGGQRLSIFYLVPSQGTGEPGAQLYFPNCNTVL
jgi:hypothetical protein